MRLEARPAFLPAVREDFQLGRGEAFCALRGAGRASRGAPGKWSRAGAEPAHTLGRQDVRRAESRQGWEKCHWDPKRLPDFILSFLKWRRCWVPPTLHPALGQGPPWLSCQAGCLPKSTWRPHTKSRGKRALESPALGFGPPPGLPQLHVNTPQQPEKEGLVSGFGLKKKGGGAFTLAALGTVHRDLSQEQKGPG